MLKHYLSILFLVNSASSIYAAPAIKSHVCSFSGEVLDVYQRVVVRNESWAKNLGIKKEVIYNDVVMNVSEYTHDTSGFSDSCQKGKNTFQIINTEDDIFKKGACIKGKAQFSGDEFKIGTWILKATQIKCD